jgi:hypothetical protein
VLTAPKTGFSIPHDNYLRNNYCSDFEDRVFWNSNPAFEFMDVTKLRCCWQGFLNGNNQALGFLWATYVLTLWFTEFHQLQTFRSVSDHG